MRWHRKLFLRICSLLHRNKLEADLDDELRFHLEQETQANIQAGLPAAEARYAALRSIGPVSAYKEECRDVRGMALIESLVRDVQYAIRMLRDAPLFTLTAILTLALGIGANTTIFTFLDNILFRPLPVKDPRQLLFLNWGTSVNMSYPDYQDFRDRNDVFSGLIAYRFIPINMSLGNATNFRVWGYEVSGNYFDLLGVQSVLGRLLRPEDDHPPGAHPLVVLSYDCWKTRFGSDPEIVGRGIKINGLSYTVVGITPSAFHGTELMVRPEFWVPVSMQAQLEGGRNWLDARDDTELWTLGRLKPGVTRQQAESSLTRIAAQLAHTYGFRDERARIKLSPPGLVGNALREPVSAFGAVLMGVAALVLLLACVNLAGMLLARASDRRKEIAVRLALGASRGRLIRQLLTEGFLLAGFGAALGFLLALWVFQSTSAWHPTFDVPANTTLVPDLRVLAFTAGAAVATTFLFGLTPALQATRTDLIPALKNEAVLARLRRWSSRDVLVTGQIALSVVLVICSVLVVRSLQQALTLNLGFNPTHAVSVSFDLPMQGYTQERALAFERRLLETVSALPGLQASGIINNLPLRVGISMDAVWIEGKPKPAPSAMKEAAIYNISRGYLAAAGTRLVQGREIEPPDYAGSHLVALVNERFARTLLPGENPIGKHFRLGVNVTDQPIEIVGVVENGNYESLGEDPQFALFEPMGRRGPQWTTLVVRTPLPPQQAIALLRRAILKMDSELTLFNVGSLRDELGFALFPAHVAAIVLGAFGLLATVLAATGIFASMAYAVSRRTREIGIRIALGAHAGQVVASILGRTFVQCGVGVLAGAMFALSAGPLLSAVLYGISPRDPATYVSSLFLTVIVALLACWYPARRALRIHPADTLREE
jgi:predicted permease